MRFGQVLALGGVVAAMEPPANQGNPYIAKFNGFVADTFGAYMPSMNKETPEAAEKVKKESQMAVLTLDNWRETLYEPVQPGATEPEEWWMLVTGRNKTCFGHCLKVEAAFNETAEIVAQREKPPHMAYLNCEDQPILCNMWSAGTGVLWEFDMLPPPANITIHIKRLNFTTTTPEDIVSLIDGGKENMKVHQGAFHPFKGWVHEYGLGLPIAYFFWIFNVVPSWAFMLIMSFVSRSYMNRGLAGGPAPPRNAPAPGTAAN